MEQISLLRFLQPWKILLKYELNTDGRKVQLMFAFRTKFGMSDNPGLRSFTIRVCKCQLHTTWD